MQIDDLDVQRRRWMNHLHRNAVFFAKGSTQGFMPGNQAIEPMAQRVGQLSRQAQRRGDVVGAAVGLQLPEEPLAFLGIGENRRLIGAAAADRSDTKRLMPFSLSKIARAFLSLAESVPTESIKACMYYLS